MATKAERFKAAEQRKRQDPTRGKVKRPRAAAAPPVKATDGQSTAARNVSTHASRKAAYALEDSRASTSRPSRKSTRKSGNRQKHGTQQTTRQTMRTRSPRARAAKAAAAAVK